MGCCGHSFKSREKIEQAITLNTLEFSGLNPQTIDEFYDFRDRSKGYFRYGICRNLIREKSGILCPLHPTLHKGKDLRIGFCNVDYLCPTAIKFNSWEKNIQKKFLKFILDQNFDSIEYSMQIATSKLLKRFEER